MTNQISICYKYILNHRYSDYISYFEKAAQKGDVHIHFISRLVVNNEPPAGMSSLGSAMGKNITII